MLSTHTPAADAIRGELLYPGDPGWDVARRTFNLVIDQQPVAIVFPVDERDVAATLAFARRRGLRVTAQATGHNAAPLGSLAGTMIINTSQLTGVSIDPVTRTVRVGAATKWEHVVPQLSKLGLAALHGSSPDVGIVGYSLGGGLGWMARRHGLQCNHVTAIELVSADGDLIRCDQHHEPDLFWALRGGGGNFGIVTAIEFAVQPVTSVYAGGLFFPYERAPEVLSAWDGLVDGFPEELMSQGTVMHFPDLPFVPEPLRGGSFAIILAAHVGDVAQAERALAPLRALGPVMDTFAVASPETLAELSMDPPSPVPYDTAHDIVGELSTDALGGLVDAAGPRSGIVMLQLRHLGGALARAPRGAGARATVPGRYALFAVGMIADEASAAASRSSLATLGCLCAGSHVGEYPSFVERPVDASALYDADTWDRLRLVKTLYDPSDLVRGNHHVPAAR